MARLRVIAELWDLKNTKEDLGAQIHKGEIGQALAYLDELDCSLKLYTLQEDADFLKPNYIGRLLAIDESSDQKVYGLFQIEDPITIRIITQWATGISSLYDGWNIGIVPRITYNKKMIDGELQITDILFQSFYLTNNSKKEFKIIEEIPDFQEFIS